MTEQVFPPTIMYLVIHGAHNPGHVSSTAFPLLEAAQWEKAYWDRWVPEVPTRVVEAVITYRLLDDEERQARAAKLRAKKAVKA